MADIDSDRISIVSKRSIASVASKISTIWSKVPHSSRKIPLPLAVICSYVETTSDAQLSPIKELIIYKEEGGVQHEFLLLRLVKPTEEFWVRLERKGPTGTLSRLISSKWEANDVATLSGKSATLLGSTKCVERTRIIFRVPPSLMALFRVLEALRESSKSYKVWPENCYFFASVIAVYLYGLDESAELIGTLRWLDLGAEARRRIHQIIASYDSLSPQDLYNESGSISPPESLAFQSPSDTFETEAGRTYLQRLGVRRRNNRSLAGGRRKARKRRVVLTPVPALVVEVGSMVVMTHDKLLIEAIFQLLQIVQAQDKLCFTLDEDKLRDGLQSSMMRLLRECKMVVYEQLHGLSDVPGARKLRDHFSRSIFRHHRCQ